MMAVQLNAKYSTLVQCVLLCLSLGLQDMDSHPTSPVFNCDQDASDLSLPFTPKPAVVHPDRSGSLAATPDGEWGCECGCVVCAERVRELTRKIWRLERALEAKNDTIASLRTDNKQKTAEVLEIHQQKVRIDWR